MWEKIGLYESVWPWHYSLIKAELIILKLLLLKTSCTYILRKKKIKGWISCVTTLWPMQNVLRWFRWTRIKWQRSLHFHHLAGVTWPVCSSQSGGCQSGDSGLMPLPRRLLRLANTARREKVWYWDQRFLGEPVGITCWNISWPCFAPLFKCSLERPLPGHIDGKHGTDN